MTLRKTTSLSTAGALGALCALGASATAAPSPQRPPNIVFFYLDDMGWTDGSCFGSDLYETPNMDRLRAQGMLFTNAYSCAPISAPARAGLLTGRNPARFGLTDVYNHRKAVRYTPVVEPQTIPDVPLEELMIPEALKPLGYKSMQVGKWHLGGYKHPFYPVDQGFDEEYTTNKNPKYPKNDYKGLDTFADKAIDFMRRNKDEPFFVYLAHLAPHYPFEAPEELTAAYAAKIRPGLNHSMPIYAATMELIDRNLGKVLAALDELGLSDNTIVIFTSDNGGRVAHVDYRPPTSNAPLRWGKHTLYEGGVRVPLIVRWPGKVAPNSTSDTPTINFDFLPTFVEIAGGDPSKMPNELDGQSILPLLLGEQGDKDRVLFWYYPHYQIGPAWGAHTLPSICRPAATIRKGDYKLMEWLEDEKAVELYNLAEDIGEKTNMAPFMPEKVAELRAELAKWKQRTNAPDVYPDPDYTPAKFGQAKPVPKTAAKK